MSKRPTSVHPLSRKLMNDLEFCRSVDRRINAAAEIVQQLPRTTQDINLLLTCAKHRLSHEVQYAVLNVLDSLPLREQDVKRLLPMVMKVLSSVESRVAGLWMKAGCLIGDRLLRTASPSTRKHILDELIFAMQNANSAYARRGALHGLEHALNHATTAEGRRILAAIRDAVRTDRARSLRTSAYCLLRDGRWWGNGGSPQLHSEARRLGKTLAYPD